MCPTSLTVEVHLHFLHLSFLCQNTKLKHTSPFFFYSVCVKWALACLQWTWTNVIAAAASLSSLQAPAASLILQPGQSFAQLKWLPRWQRPSPAAGGWRWRQSSRICFSLPCCWAGVPCSSCSSQRASTPTSALFQVGGSLLASVVLFMKDSIIAIKPFFLINL